MAYHCSSWTIMVDSYLFNKITEDHGRPWSSTMVKDHGAIVQKMVYNGPQIMISLELWWYFIVNDSHKSVWFVNK